MSAPVDHYALVLMDIEMPVMDGREAIRRLRDDKRFADLPIIVMTAYVQGADLQKVLSQGASGYIAKPFDPDELLASIARYCHGGPSLPATPAVATTAEQAFLAALRAVPGLDAAVLERRFSGRLRFLAEAIRCFVEDARQLPARLRNAIDEGDVETARRDAHSFKGLAGTFGMRDLQEALRRLEAVIAPQVQPESELTAVERCLAAVLDDLAGLPAVSGDAVPVGTLGDAEAVVGALIRHLRDGDGEVEEIWRNNRALLTARYAPRQLAKIERAIAHWDCEAAIQALGEPTSREENK